MKITIEVQVDRVEGRNLSAAAVGEHICETIMVGEVPADPGNIWVEDTHYRLRSARPVNGEVPA